MRNLIGLVYPLITEIYLYPISYNKGFILFLSVVLVPLTGLINHIGAITAIIIIIIIAVKLP